MRTQGKTIIVQSPCIHVCSIDAASGLCLGCVRTLDEIAVWSTLGDDARARIIAALPARRARAGLPLPAPLQEAAS